MIVLDTAYELRTDFFFCLFFLFFQCKSEFIRNGKKNGICLEFRVIIEGASEVQGRGILLKGIMIVLFYCFFY